MAQQYIIPILSHDSYAPLDYYRPCIIIDTTSTFPPRFYAYFMRLYGQTSVGRMCKMCDYCGVASVASTFSLKAQEGYMEMIYFITLRTFSYITPYYFFLSLKAICVFKSFIFHGFDVVKFDIFFFAYCYSSIQCK